MPLARLAVSGATSTSAHSSPSAGSMCRNAWMQGVRKPLMAPCAEFNTLNQICTVLRPLAASASWLLFTDELCSKEHAQESCSDAGCLHAPHRP